MTDKYLMANGWLVPLDKVALKIVKCNTHYKLYAYSLMDASTTPMDLTIGRAKWVIEDALKDIMAFIANHPNGTTGRRVAHLERGKHDMMLYLKEIKGE